MAYHDWFTKFNLWAGVGDSVDAFPAAVIKNTPKMTLLLHIIKAIFTVTVVMT